MYTRERCFLLGLCLLGGVTFCLTAVDTEAQIITISEMETGYLNQVCRAYNEDEDDKKVKDTNDKDTQRVQPLQIELQNDTTESKSTYTAKEANAKTTNEIKKKPVMDLKTRSDQKYRGRSDQKPIVKDDDSWRPVNPDVSMTSSISPTTISVRMNQSTTKIGADAIDVTIPFLLHGAPIAAVTKATPMTSLRDMSNNTVKVTDETTSSRGRALNISAPEPTNSLHANITDLSDVSMDEDDKEVEGGEYIAPHNETAINISSAELSKPGCIYENHNYSIGEKIVRGCEAKCVCSENGITNCQPVCNDRFIKASEEIDKPHCRKHVTEEEPCCALLVCESHFGNKKTDNETCMFGNRTVGRKERIEDGCSRICVCEDDGHLKCQPRCPPNETTTTANQHDRCVTLASPSDPCCNITYCDVTLGDHEIKSDNSTDLNVHLMNVKVLNSTAIKLKFSTKNPEDISVEISQNRHVWSQRKPDKDGVISNLIPARTYYIRTTEGSGTEPFVVILPAEVLKTNISEKTSDKNFCHYKGKSYKIGAEWYDDCVFYCSCLETGMHSCSTIMCPTDFGLDLINPDCFDWETVDFVNPKPPHCCPQEVLCRNDGSCNYEGGKYKNWSELPINVTGCEKRCYCEMGNVSCQPACPAVPALPPAHLPCTSNEAKLTQHPIRSCCLEWTCNRSSLHGQGHDIVHPSYSANIPGFQAADEIIIQGLEALDEHRVRVVFTIPSVLVGLHGRIELRYTSDKENNNVSTWEAQVYSLPNDLIDMPHLEFELDNLEPSTEYKVKITAKLNNLTNSPTSKIYSVRTSDVESILPPQIPVDTEVKIVAVNSTWINVMWRKFTEYELQFIDGVQLRYKEHDTHSKIYSATPLIHRAVTNYVIENLKPSTTYEVGIYFIPFPGQSTELWSDKTIEVTTSTEPDPYSFEVKVEIKTVKSTDVEVSWSGVPYPEDKYVNIFRAIYQSDTGKEDASTFKIAKRDSHAKTVISELKPGTRYRLWLEIYLTNGRIKKSNVQDFITKPGIVLPASVSEQAGKFTTLPLHEGDYYGPLVIVAIVASLAILSTLILLMMLMKRRTSSKADISPRKATSMYDNPSYKTCEEVVIISNGRNKTAAEHEMATITSNVKETI